VPARAEDPEQFIETRIHPAVPAQPEAVTDSTESLVDQIDREDRKNLGRNSALMASGTLVSRILGMVNASLQTAVLGTLVVGDAFKSANTLPNFILVLLSGGILNAVLIPQITKAMKRPDGGKDFVDRLVTAAFALIVLVAVACTAGAAVLMRVFTSLSGTGLQLAIAFAYICMPQVLFYGIFAVLGNILNARGRFGAYGWAPVANNVVAISGLAVFLYLWGQQPHAEAWTPAMIWVLAGSATLGIAVQAAILVPALYRSGFRWTPRWGLRGHGFGQLGRFASLTFLALLIAQGGGLLIMKVATHIRDAADATGADVASYLTYQNALSIFQMPYALLAVSLLTALFPQIARAWQRRDDPEVGMTDMQELVRRGLTLPALGVIPASAVLIALAGPAIRVVYFSLDAQEAAATSAVLVVMCASMLGYTIVTLQQQYCFASEQGITNLWMQIVVTAVQVVFALLAYLVPLEYGLLVIVAGMFFGNWALAIIFVLYARHQIGSYGLRSVGLLYVRLGVASAVAGVAAWATALVVLAQQNTPELELGRMMTWAWQFGAGVAGGLVFIAVLLVVAKLMRIREFFDFVNPILRRLRLPIIG
jgi:putative peptidoglycan lipid II flippase